MQEMYLSSRILHFVKGQMVWECSEVCLGQGEWVDSRTDSIFLLRTVIKTFQRALQRPYIFALLEDADKDRDKRNEATCNSMSNQLGQGPNKPRTSNGDHNQFECNAG
jgi:hypothetical protein